MAANSPYRRLPGRGAGVASSVRLYEAPDHLLQISSTGFTENYKRFYFRDIQAVILEAKPWQMWWFVVFGFSVLLFAAPASVSSGVAAIVLWSTAAGFALALLINLLLGPCCACYIRTAVQTERLGTVRRVRPARAFMQYLADQATKHQQEPSISSIPTPVPQDSSRSQASPIATPGMQ
jgi:hypothetical protein